MSAKPVVVLDACALIPIRLATTLLWLAEAGLFQPLWSETILDEVERNLLKVGLTPEAAARRVTMMRTAFDTEALVEEFEDLVDQMQCDPKDRHVLAAGVAGGAEMIVTFNLKDFPDDAVAAHRIRVVHPDSFLLQLLLEHQESVLATLERQTLAFRRPPSTVPEFLATLTPLVPTFANFAADALDERSESLAPVPALVEVAPERAFESLGEHGDTENPAQVALMWWKGLMDDLSLARALTYHPPAWKGYQWAIDCLANKSLASKVLCAVDAPDRIVFMRFIPEVATTSQVFDAYQTTVTFLTLIRVDDGTWRVWGLGPGLRSAAEIIRA